MKLQGVVRVLILGIGAGLAGCSGENPSPAVHEEAMDMSAVKQDLQTLSKARILLGHQSVGRNVLAGLQQLATEAAVPLRILQIDAVPPDDEPGLFHSNIGRNGDPDSKCEVFSQLLTRPEKPPYDLAMMKFCYVDLERGVSTEAARMLDRYARTVSDIRERRPDVRLVHVSLPLMADPPGKKTFLKRLLNRATERDADNILRNAFNTSLRERFAGEPLFDLAAVESTLPDGSRSAFSNNGQAVYTLAPQYTDDGGHLNEAGRRRAAIQLARTLAAALEVKGGRGAWGAGRGRE